jgi:hypothetical protein
MSLTTFIVSTLTLLRRKQVNDIFLVVGEAAGTGEVDLPGKTCNLLRPAATNFAIELLPIFP